MSLVIWILRLLGLKQWAAALEGAKEGYTAEVRAEVVEKEAKVDAETVEVQREVATAADGKLDDLVDRMLERAEDHNRKRGES